MIFTRRSVRNLTSDRRKAAFHMTRLVMLSCTEWNICRGPSALSFSLLDSHTLKLSGQKPLGVMAEKHLQTLQLIQLIRLNRKREQIEGDEGHQVEQEPGFPLGQDCLVCSMLGPGVLETCAV